MTDDYADLLQGFNFFFLKLLFSIRNFPISSLFLFSAVNYHMINLLMSQPVAKYSANVILLSSY